MSLWLWLFRIQFPKPKRIGLLPIKGVNKQWKAMEGDK